MASPHQLKENTNLINEYFPFNIFHISSNHHNILGLHWHDNIEIIYFNSGHAVFNIGNKTVTAVPGDILFVNSKQLHSGYSIDNTLADYFAIVFNKSLLVGQTPDPYLLKYVSPFMEGKALFPVKIDQSCKIHEFLQQTINQIINEFNEKKPGYELAIKSYIYLIITFILRYHKPLKSIDIDHQRHIEQVERFKPLMNYVEKNFHKKISIDQAAKILNLSPYYFCKIFKKITGRTFLEFLNLYRINKAEEILRNTSLSVTQVAEKVGFCNINYFDKMFKRYKHYSPSQCRK